MNVMPDKKQLIDFLHHSGVMTPAMASDIAEAFEYRRFEKNELLLRQGKVSNEYLFVNNGILRAFAIDTNGQEVTTAFYQPREIVFEVSSFFNRVRSQENIRSLTDGDGWFITYEKLNQLFHAIPAFREFGRHILVKGFTSLKTRTLSMITETAEERYAYLLETNPQLVQLVPVKYIASFLGITDTSLSRIRASISKK